MNAAQNQPWTACIHSGFFNRLLARDPELQGVLAAHVEAPLTHEVIATLWEACAPQGVPDLAGVKRGLRRLRNRVLAIAMERDLRGEAGVPEITSAMTSLADFAVNEAYRWLAQDLARDFGVPRGESTGQAQELLIIGMGKLGGCELNVSSDIDLVLLYPEDGHTDGGATGRTFSNHEFFARIGRGICALLGEITEDGFVFRVDLRLRPEGESGPLALPLAALEPYFLTRGRDWERYAWVKARVLPTQAFEPDETARAAAIAELESIRTPFVYRKYLDFDALASLRDLRQRITQELSRKSHGGGIRNTQRLDDIKLGTGGIREIEFVAQVFQLIRGGRITALRVRPTLEALATLERLVLLGSDTVQQLTEAYLFYRQLEHRLQYEDDQQTHQLPADPERRQRLAYAMGYADTPEGQQAFEQALSSHRNLVHTAFQSVLGAIPAEDETHQDWRARIQTHFPDQAVEWTATIEQWLQSSRMNALSERNRARLEALCTAAVAAMQAHAGPDGPSGFEPVQALHNTLRLLETISRRSSYLAMLAEYPRVMQRVVKVMGTSDWATQYVISHPILLDELLDEGILGTRESVDEARARWNDTLAALRAADPSGELDRERTMHAMREFHHQRVFHLVLQDLEGMHTLEHFADRLTEQADLILEIALPLCWAQIRDRHRPDPRFAVIGYGKLGAKEMGFGSDLDIVFLYEDDAPEARELYAKLAQRLSSWLTTLTPAGRLYEIDLRLRPEGEAGLLVSPLDTFKTYQRTSAWTWEHQALTRARFCAGDTQVGQQFDAFRSEFLAQARDLDTLRTEILAMRKKMQQAHPSHPDWFDLKHDTGGMIDLEFSVQYLVLAHAAQHPELLGNLGSIALLMISANKQLIPADVAQNAIEAYRCLRRLQHRARMRSEAKVRVGKDALSAEKVAIKALWDAVFFP